MCEFAEYDSNLYCLANLIASRSSGGDFHLELIKDAVPGCVLAVTHAKVNNVLHEELDLLSSSEEHALPKALSKMPVCMAFASRVHEPRFSKPFARELSEASFSENKDYKEKPIYGLRGRK